MKATIGDVDIAIATNDSDKAIDHFIHYPFTERVIEKGDISASVLISGGKQVDLMTQPPKSFGSLLQHSRLPLFASALVYVLLLGTAVAAMPQHLVVTPSQLAARLASDDWQQRSAALQYIYQHQIDLNLYQAKSDSSRQMAQMITSTHIAERYWYGMALSFSSAPSADDDLQLLLQDEQINVVCAALNAIGRRGEKNLIVPVKNLLLDSKHWYVQWYAYTALQRMGWRNSRE